MNEDNQKLCNCSTPFPCVFPVPDRGIECDNCGEWLMPEKGNQATIELLQNKLDELWEKKNSLN